MTEVVTNAAYAAARHASAFERTRAAWLDRLVGHAQICAAVDDPWGATAYAIEVEAAVEGATMEAWVAALGQGSARAWPHRAAGLEVTGQFARVAIGVARWASEARPGEAADARGDVVAAVAELLARDPDIDLARPRYRWRLPWTGDGLAAFHALLAPVFAEVPAAAPIVPAADAALARIAEAVDRWQALLGHGDAAAPARDPGADAAVLAACRASVHADCDALLARDRVWPEPLRRAHAAMLRAAVDAAATPIELDLACARAAACADVEACWLRTLLATVGAPLRAALIAAYEPSAAATAGLARARAHATAVVGEPDPWRLPWFTTLVEGAIVPHATGSLDGVGSHAGEGGIELLGPWRTWSAVAAATGGIADRRAALALTVTTAPSVPSRRRIVLWDREVDALDATALRDAPPRPRLGTS